MLIRARSRGSRIWRMLGSGAARPAQRPPGPAGPGGPGGPAMRFAPGHFYSPLPDTRELAAEPARSRVWPPRPREALGIDWREHAQLALCRDVFARQQRLEFPAEATGDPRDYHAANGPFPMLDAWVLEGMLRHLRPRRLIEVGCGFSSLVTARVNRELLAGEIAVTCIDPHPPRVLLDGVEGIGELRAEQVQQTPLALFEELAAGDVLFIDSSHVAKTGSDVVWLQHEVLPRLASGVSIEIHDVFIPGDYPPPWVLDGWGWNETYLVRSFLAFNSAFEIDFANHFMFERHRDALLEAFPRLADDPDTRGGLSLWIRRA